MFRQIAYESLILFANLLFLSKSLAIAETRVDSSRAVQEICLLEPGKPIERELKAGEVHVYQIILAKKQYVQIAVDQRGIDLVETLFGPERKQLIKVDSPAGPLALDLIYWVAESAGSYRLEVHSLDKEATDGRYEVKIKELRPSVPQDHAIVAAVKVFAEANQLLQLYFDGKVESRQPAIAKYQEALPLLRAVGLEYEEGLTLFELGMCYAMLDERQKGLEYYLQALPLVSKFTVPRAQMVLFNQTGAMYLWLGDIQKAIEYFKQCLAVNRAVNLREGEAEVLLNLAGAYSALGEMQQAFESVSHSLSLSRVIGYRSNEATGLYTLGNVYNKLGEKRKALDYYSQALQFWRTLGYRGAEASALSSIGEIYADWNDRPKALDFYNQALAVAQSLERRNLQAQTLNRMGLVYAAMEQPRKALDYYGQARQVLQAAPHRQLEAHTLCNLGEAHRLLGERQKGLDYYREGFQISHDMGEKHLEAHSLLGLARLERDLGHFNQARTHIEAALTIIDSLRTKVAAQEMRVSYFATTQEYHAFYIDVLMKLHQLQPSNHHDAEALQAGERARARGLLEILAEAGAGIRQGADSTLLQQEHTLQQLLNHKAERLIKLRSQKYTAANFNLIKQALDSLLIEYQQVQARIRTTSPRYAALTQPQPLSAKEIQQQVLDDETILLEYALGEERSFLWAVTPTSLNSFELPKRATIDSLARRVYDLLTARNQRVANETPKQKRERVAKADAGYQKTAAALSRILLAPVADQIGTKRLLVVTDGALQYIPFGALPAPMTTGYKPLSSDHEIVSLPSASVLAVLRREIAGRQSAPKTVAVLADPVFTSEDSRVKRNGAIAEKKPIASLASSRMLEDELERTARDFELRDTTGLRIPRLPFSRQEAEGIVAKLPTNEIIKALDFAANRTTATSTELSQFRIVHFATHGLLNSEHPELSGIVLSLVNENGEAQDGFLRLHEIYNLNLPADLVVLSACQTALGKEIKGEGLVGLTRGFMYAGAARVVASLWKVDDEATAELMKRFYQNMLGSEKLRPAAALRDAQVSMCKEKRWQAPYYWAAFVLQGEWK